MSALPQAVQSVGIFNGPYYLSIAGNLVKSQDSFDVINPATGEVFAKAPAASAEQLEEAVAAARTGCWRSLVGRTNFEDLSQAQERLEGLRQTKALRCAWRTRSNRDLLGHQ